MMFQNYALFPHLAVRDNIAFGLKRAGMARADIDARVAEMVALVRLEGMEKRKPDQLSGGQKQRVALARALLNDPEVLVLDDPLSAVDAKTERSILEALDRAAEDRTLILITNRTAAAAHCDKVLVLEAGRIVEQGSARALIAAGGRYAALCQKQTLEQELEAL
jgi:putrescine transport system ATP-binding protein